MALTETVGKEKPSFLEKKLRMDLTERKAELQDKANETDDLGHCLSPLTQLCLNQSCTFSYEGQEISVCFP